MAGNVKTRLADSLGVYRSVSIYCHLLHLTVDKLSESDLYQTWIFCDSPEYINSVKMMFDNRKIDFSLQKGSDLGDRLSHAFREIFDKGGNSNIAIGSDCFELKVEILEEAFQKLNSGTFNTVIGPTIDGGYYLIGLNRYVPSIFRGIEWSTDRVYRQTTKLIKDNENLICCELPRLNDIDNVDDLTIGFINSLKRFRPEFRLYLN